MWIDWCCLSFKLCFSGPPSGSSSGTGIFRMNVETFETCSSFPCLPLRFETAACVCDGVWVSEERRGHCLVRTLTEGNHKVTAVHISGMIDAVGRCSPPPPTTHSVYGMVLGVLPVVWFRSCQPRESPPSPIMKAINEVALNSNRL